MLYLTSSYFKFHYFVIMDTKNIFELIIASHTMH